MSLIPVCLVLETIEYGSLPEHFHWYNAEHYDDGSDGTPHHDILLGVLVAAEIAVFHAFPLDVTVEFELVVTVPVD